MNVLALTTTQLIEMFGAIEAVEQIEIAAAEVGMPYADYEETILELEEWHEDPNGIWVKGSEAEGYSMIIQG